VADAHPRRSLLCRADLRCRRVRGVGGLGLVAGRNAAALVLGREPSAPPRETAIGALGFYVANANPKHYEPSNITFRHHAAAGLNFGGRVPKKKADRKTLYAERALAALDDWIHSSSAVGAAATAAE
jgi:methylenetetrahydrofolate--tRNA-(uracil-5-)-methyltransferase